jgi:hypothetical protein
MEGETATTRWSSITGRDKQRRGAGTDPTSDRCDRIVSASRLIVFSSLFFRRTSCRSAFSSVLSSSTWRDDIIDVRRG